MTEGESLERETLRAAAAKPIMSPEAIRAAEHRLQPLAGLLEPNPRSMDYDVCLVLGRAGEKGQLTLSSLKPVVE